MRHDRAALHGAGKVRWEWLPRDVAICHRITVDVPTKCSLRTTYHLGDAARKQLMVSEGAWQVTRDACSNIARAKAGDLQIATPDASPFVLTSALPVIALELRPKSKPSASVSRSLNFLGWRSDIRPFQQLDGGSSAGIISKQRSLSIVGYRTFRHPSAPFLQPSALLQPIEFPLAIETFPLKYTSFVPILGHPAIPYQTSTTRWVAAARV